VKNCRSNFAIVYRDGQGQTPFMLAVSSRAYRAALILFDAAQRCTTQEQRTAAIFPHNAPPDHSPLFVLCCNDTCSFTWTGQEHINQVLKKRIFFSSRF
jgi:E3 ubiquitin-protein ligase EDD1